MEPLDKLFLKSETQKNISLSDGAWNRLEDLLDSDNSKSKWNKLVIMGIAASFLLLVGFWGSTVFPTAEDYKLEQLVIDKKDFIYSSADIAHLNSEYDLLNQRIAYDLEGKVKAKDQ